MTIFDPYSNCDSNLNLRKKSIKTLLHSFTQTYISLILLKYLLKSREAYFIYSNLYQIQTWHFGNYYTKFPLISSSTLHKFHSNFTSNLFDFEFVHWSISHQIKLSIKIQLNLSRSLSKGLDTVLEMSKIWSKWLEMV